MSPLRLCLLAGALLAAATVVQQLGALPPVARGLALTAALAGLAVLSRLTPADLGLRRETWSAGVRLGGAVSLLVVAGYGVALAVAPIRRLVADPPDPSWTAGIVAASVVIPLATVVPEELAFRGVLWGGLRRGYGERTATAVSAVLFGLWHVPSSLNGSPANATITDAAGDDAVATLIRVVGTVLFTGMAGVLFAELRRRSDSLLAPVTLHWAVNGSGVLFVLAA